jgi:hypothetical protein
VIPDDLRESLRLDQEALRVHADFYKSYAEASAQFPEIDPSGYEGAEGRGEGISRYPEGAEGDGVDREAMVPRRVEREEWVAEGERADALREAAASMLLVDPQQGKKLLIESALRYGQQSRAYSMFLLAIADPRNAESQSQGAAQLLGIDYDPKARRFVDAARSGVRDLYLLLTISADQGAVQRSWEMIDLVREGPPSRSLIPFGIAGSPLADWWALAIALCAPPGEVDREELIRHFERLARPRGVQLRAAQRDTYHWHGLYGRADLVDLDLAGAVQIANLRLAADDRRLPLIREDFGEDLPPLAQVSLAVGIDLGRDEGIGRSVRA